MSSETTDKAISDSSDPAASRPAVDPAKEKASYGQILKSSALIGGSSILNILIGVIRTKAMALLVGPAGVGLIGLYQSIIELVHSIAGMGINNSGVREIAEAVGSEDEKKIAQTAIVLKRVSFVLGIVGCCLMVGLSGYISNLTFGNEDHSDTLKLLAFGVLCYVVSDGQKALVQGTRRIADLAKISVLGALLGTLISIPLVYFFRTQGIAPGLVFIGAMMMLTSWWYSRKVPVLAVSVTVTQIKDQAAALLKLGFVFMSSGLMMLGSAYLIRIIVVRNIGFDAAGLFQAAWALGGLYVGFILQAMGADFYPRLTAIIKDNTVCNRIVNEQTLVSLLLAGPGVIATLAFAPLVIWLFYSAKFDGAVEVLRWLCLGMTLRIISWPIGYIIVAKGARKAFFWSELAWTVFYLGLAYDFVARFGLNGIGMAFFASYIFHCVLIYVIVRRLSGFRWSVVNKKTSLLFLSLIAAVFGGFYVLPYFYGIGVGLLAVFLASIYSVRALVNLVSPEQIPGSILRLLILFRFTDGTDKHTSDSISEDKLLVLIQSLIYLLIVGIAIYVGVALYNNFPGPEEMKLPDLMQHLSQKFK